MPCPLYIASVFPHRLVPGVCETQLAAPIGGVGGWGLAPSPAQKNKQKNPVSFTRAVKLQVFLIYFSHMVQVKMSEPTYFDDLMTRRLLNVSPFIAAVHARRRGFKLVGDLT